MLVFVEQLRPGLTAGAPERESRAPLLERVLSLSRDNVRVKCSAKMSVVFCNFSDGEVDGLTPSATGGGQGQALLRIPRTLGLDPVPSSQFRFGQVIEFTIGEITKDY